MDNHSTKGKSGLIRELIAKGMSVRRAEKAVNAVFTVMTNGVRRGETVEIPGGALQARTMNGKPRQAWQRFKNVQTGKINFRIVKYPGQRRVVKFKPDQSLDLTPLPEPPPPPTAEDIQCRQLATELIGKSADDAAMKLLKRAAAFPPQRPGNLLARLRDCQQRGLRYSAATWLAQDIERVYWL